MSSTGEIVWIEELRTVAKARSSSTISGLILDVKGPTVASLNHGEKVRQQMRCGGSVDSTYTKTFRLGPADIHTVGSEEGAPYLVLDHSADLSAAIRAMLRRVRTDWS